MSHGEIVSHLGYLGGFNYGKNLDCIWRIEAPDGLHVQLVAETFSLEPDERYVLITVNSDEHNGLNMKQNNNNTTTAKTKEQ